MDRRRFLVQTARAGSALLIVPAGWLAGCTDSKDSPSDPVDPPANGLRFTSDKAGIHTHDFTIAMDELATPGDGGVQGPTTVSLGHKHIVKLTQAELTRIQAGETLNKVTSIVDGHIHNFKFSLATAQAQGDAPPTADGSAPSSSGG
jgi:hypothetical protein